MLPVVSELNKILAIGTVTLQVIVLVYLITLFYPKSNFAKIRLTPLRHHALLIGFLLTLGASILTLVYSDVFGFIPCGLCWFQRVFLYPQVVIFGVALWKKDRSIFPYIFWLSIIGLVIALYQHYLQVGGTDLLPCPASGNGDCGKRIIFEFDYITFPLMAATIFAFQTILAAVGMKKSD